MKRRSNPSAPSNNNSFRGLRPTLRPNVFLRCHRHYQPPFRHPLRGKHTSTMNLRRLLSRQRHPNPFLCIPLPPSLRHCSPDNNPPTFPPRNRLKQPPRTKLKRRQNFISPILFIQRPSGLRNPPNCPYFPSTLLPQPPRRPRQFYPCQPPGHTTSY